MKKRTLVLTAVLLVGIMVFATTAIGAEATRNIRAYYRNIKLKVNGQIAAAEDVEPFLYNDRVYVPIRLVSTALDKNVHWDNNQNTVIITDKVDQSKVNQEVAALKQQLAAKESEINTLKLQNSYANSRIIDLEKTIADYKSEEKKTESRKKDYPDEYLEDYLYDEYSKWNSIRFDFKVKESRGDLTLTIEFDRGDYRNEWNKLSERKIENWLDDIYDFVQDEFPKAAFEGEIRDTDNRETLVEFYESRNKLKVEFIDGIDDLDDLEYELNKRYGSGLTKYHRDFGKLTAEIYVDESRYDDELDITIEVNTSKYDTEWSNVYDTVAADDWIYDIVDYVLGEYRKYSVYGIVEDSKGRTQATFDSDSSGRFRIDWE